MEFEIDRETWHRGQGSNTSQLLLENGNKCCLGFYLKACGISDLVIYNKGTPKMVANELENSDEQSKIPSWLLIPADRKRHYINSDSCRALINYNDVSSTTDEEKEAKIKEVFAANGVTVTFK